VIIVHYDETQLIELKVKSASKWSKGFDVSLWLGCQCYFLC